MKDLDSKLKNFSKKLENSLEEDKINKSVLKSGANISKKMLDVLSSEQSSQFKPMTHDKFIKSLEEKKVLPEIIEKLSLVNVDYRGFDDDVHRGQVVIHKDLEASITRVFKRILAETNFPIASVFPISMFNWNSSSISNNSGAFDWRFVSDSDEISDHTFGAAIDINPVQNPQVREGYKNSPDFPYDPSKRGTLHKDSAVVKIFEEEGWKWGGRWDEKDWMHFYRPEIGEKYYGKTEMKE